MATMTPPIVLTHFDAKSDPPWLAIHLESALKALSGYPVTKRQKTDIGYLMARYCRLLDEAGLLHYGRTKEEASAKAVGLAHSSVETPPKLERVAWVVEIDSRRCIIFATTKTKAQWIAVRTYWDAYGRRRGEWPRAKAWRAERYDKCQLRRDEIQMAYFEDYVQSWMNSGQ